LQFVTRRITKNSSEPESVPLQSLTASRVGAAGTAAVADTALGGGTGSNTAADTDDEVIPDVPVALEDDLDDDDDDDDEFNEVAAQDSEADALSVRSVTYIVEEEPSPQDFSPTPDESKSADLPGAVPGSS
jgi:hypothetical protein